MKEISDAVLSKVKGEAQAIVRAAEEKAERELEAARSRREERLGAEKRRRKTDAEAEAARIVAQGTMEARNTVAAAKAGLMADITEGARTSLEKLTPEPGQLGRLIADALGVFDDAAKVKVGVREQDLDLAKEAVANDDRIKDAVTEVVARPIGGGVVLESEDGSTLVDNSYAARLDMLLPRVIVRIGKDLFGK